jgi:SulP family sulfate permease
VLAGIIQILAGLFKLGKLMHSSTSRNLWFCKWISNNYFMSQLNQFKDASGNWLTGQSLYILVGLVLLTIIMGLPKLTKAIPASLIAILAVFNCSWIWY